MAQTTTGSGTIAGYFEDHAAAERAVQALREAGFTSAHLGVAHSSASGYGSSNYGTETGTSTPGTSTSGTVSGAAHKAGEKAEGVWDKVKNFFEGGAEPYATERNEGDLATREITSSGYRDDYDDSRYTNNNDLHGSLTGLSVPEDRSRYFGHRLGSANEGALVTVNAGDRNSEAESILRQYGADLGDNAAGYDYDSTPTTGNYASSQNLGTEGVAGQDLEGTRGTGNTRNIQLLGEILRVHKDRISRGEVVVRKEVITENQTVQVPVTREELVIERRAVDGTTPASGTVGDTADIRIPLTEERASIDKSTVVREEVAVGTRPVQEVRDLSGEVRREELVVDDQTKKTV